MSEEMKLEPCPLCGNGVSIRKESIYFDEIKCSCGLVLTSKVIETREEFVARWNTRQQPDNSAALRVIDEELELFQFEPDSSPRVSRCDVLDSLTKIIALIGGEGE